MKILAFKTAWVTIFLALFLNINSAFAQKIELVKGVDNSFNVTVNSFERLQVASIFTQFNAISVSTEKGHFVEFTSQNYTKSNVVGNPQLPVISKLIEVPAGATPIVTVKSYDVTEYKLSDLGINDKLMPTQPSQPKSGALLPFEMNTKLYSTNAFYGEELARVEISGYMRATRLANIIISPVEYNPVTNTIRVYQNMIIDVEFSGADRQATMDLKAKTNSMYFNSISKVLNPIKLENTRDTMSKVPVKYVIVSDPMFKDQLKPFVNWKIKRGFKVIEAYTNDAAVGNTFNSIKAYLKNLYTSATAADPAPTFVLLVGDVAQIPTYNCGQHYSDLYYVEYSGDFLPEVYNGRFSANNATELQPQIDKTLEYERYLFSDPTFLDETIMIAGDDASHEMTWGNGQVNYGTTNYFNAAHGITCHAYLQPEPAGANYSQQIKDNISNGVAYANYTAHGFEQGWGDPSLTISDIPNLTNKGKYPLMVGNCCLTSVFNGVTFGEEIVRAKDKGALGYIGASNSTYWDEDFWWGVGLCTVSANVTYAQSGLGAYDRTFHENGEPRSEWYSTMQQMTVAGLLAVQESNSSRKKYYWEVYCLMGDPSTMVYYTQAPKMKYEALPLLPLGNTTFEIKTEPYAYVALTRNNVIHGVAEADATGKAVLNITPFTSPGYASVVMTKQNFKPYIDSVLVASPEGPYLVLTNHKFIDVQGNNNSIPEYDETLNMNLHYNNYGKQDAVNALSTITTTSSYAEIVNGTYTWDNIPSEGQATANNVFDIHVKNGTPDMTNINFTLNTKVGTENFTDIVKITVNAPKLVHSTFIVDDATSGNGNGLFDPGETIFIKIPISNNGHCKTSAMTSELFITDANFIEVLEGTQNHQALNVGQSDTARFKIKVSNTAPVGAQFTMHMLSSAGMYYVATTVQPQIGEMLEDFETGDFTKYAWQMSNTPFVTTTSAYNGDFSAKSGIIGNNGKSTMSISGNVLRDDNISFYRRTGTQADKDFLVFYIDDVAVGKWSGNNPWDKVQFPVTAGQHTFKWQYEKDPATLVQPDAVWIDDIKFPPFSQSGSATLSVFAAATPSKVCKNDETMLIALVGGATSMCLYEWTPAVGLSNPKISNPVAVVSETTTYTVKVTCGSEVATASVTVTVEPAPAAPVITLVGDYELKSNYTTGNQWYNNEGIIEGATSQTYTAPHTNLYYCIHTNELGCQSEPSNTIQVNYVSTNLKQAENVFVSPNPFNSFAMINYTLTKESDVRVQLFNSIGQMVYEKDLGTQTSGTYSSRIDTQNLNSGIYICKIIRGADVKIIKIIKNK